MLKRKIQIMMENVDSRLKQRRKAQTIDKELPRIRAVAIEFDLGLTQEEFKDEIENLLVETRVNLIKACGNFALVGFETQPSLSTLQFDRSRVVKIDPIHIKDINNFEEPEYLQFKDGEFSQIQAVKFDLLKCIEEFKYDAKRYRAFAFEYKIDISKTEIKIIANLIVKLESRIDKVRAQKNCIFVGTKTALVPKCLTFDHTGILTTTGIRRELFKKLVEEDCIFKFEPSVRAPHPPSKPGKFIQFKAGKFRYTDLISFSLTKMLNGMKLHSVKLKMEFDMTISKQKLLEAFNKIEENFECGCNRPHCTDIMEFHGKNAISPDRLFDKQSYITNTQIITFITKPHNTTRKYGHPDEERKYHVKWVLQAANHMTASTIKRIDSLKKQSELSKFFKDQIERYENDEKLNQQYYIDSLWAKKKLQNDLCFRCKAKMYFGDENGLLTIINCHQASPDRINDDYIFYDPNNYNLVCFPCNYNTNSQKSRTYIANKAKNDPVPLTKELIEECKVWLQKKK